MSEILTSDCQGAFRILSPCQENDVALRVVEIAILK